MPGCTSSAVAQQSTTHPQSPHPHCPPRPRLPPARPSAGQHLAAAAADRCQLPQWPAPGAHLQWQGGSGRQSVGERSEKKQVSLGRQTRHGRQRIADLNHGAARQTSPTQELQQSRQNAPIACTLHFSTPPGWCTPNTFSAYLTAGRRSLQTLQRRQRPRPPRPPHPRHHQLQRDEQQGHQVGWVVEPDLL